jgi:hypothetical protein
MSGFSTRQVTGVIGLVIGLALGLLYTWVIAPVELVNTHPALLRTDYRRGWVRLAALSYVADGDLERARARLDGLKQEDVASVIQALIEEYAAAGRPADTLRSLTTLAKALDVHTPAMLVYLYAPTSSPRAPVRTPPPTSTSTPTPVPTPTPTLRASPSPAIPTSTPTHTATPVSRDTSPLSTPTSEPTRTPPPPTPTPPLLARLQLAQQEKICEPGRTPRIEVLVTDERGAGLAGVEIWLMWPGGADRAVTGLKPQNGAGYADFNAELGARYVLGIGELGMPLVTDLRIEPCPLQDDEEPQMGSWRLVLKPRSLNNGESESGSGR